MKKVFSKPEDVAHLWANRHQDEARTPTGNFYFNGDIIYSYGSHFPIARIMEDGVVLFTLDTYSNTTTKHIGVANMACRHRDRIYCLNINTYKDTSGWDHKGNLTYWSKQLTTTLELLARARKPEKYISSIEHFKGQIDKYVSYFKLDVSITCPELNYILIRLSSQEYITFSKELWTSKVAYEKEVKHMKLKAVSKSIAEWLKGENVSPYGYKYDFLRVTDKGRIETTQRVEIPYIVAKMFHKLIKTNKVAVGDSILNFRVDEIGNVIKIGCHRFRKTYLVKFGNNLKKPKKIID